MLHIYDFKSRRPVSQSYREGKTTVNTPHITGKSDETIGRTIRPSGLCYFCLGGANLVGFWPDTPGNSQNSPGIVNHADGGVMTWVCFAAWAAGAPLDLINGMLMIQFSLPQTFILRAKKHCILSKWETYAHQKLGLHTWQVKHLSLSSSISAGYGGGWGGGQRQFRTDWAHCCRMQQPLC